MNRRFELTDQEWERLAPLLPAMTSQQGGRWRDHRQVLNGILFRTRTGVPWRDLPERYGPWEVERLMNRRKQFRAVATRFDKLADRYQATITIADIFIWLRARPDQPRSDSRNTP